MVALRGTEGGHPYMPSRTEVCDGRRRSLYLTGPSEGAKAERGPGSPGRGCVERGIWELHLPLFFGKIDTFFNFMKKNGKPSTLFQPLSHLRSALPSPPLGLPVGSTEAQQECPLAVASHSGCPGGCGSRQPGAGVCTQRRTGRLETPLR